MHIASFPPLRGIPQNMNRPCAAIAAAVLAVLAAGNANADDYLAPIGGPGRGHFQAPCPDGQLLIGFDLRAAMRSLMRPRRLPRAASDRSRQIEEMSQAAITFRNMPCAFTLK